MQVKTNYNNIQTKTICWNPVCCFTSWKTYYIYLELRRNSLSLCVYLPPPPRFTQRRACGNRQFLVWLRVCVIVDVDGASEMHLEIRYNRIKWNHLMVLLTANCETAHWMWMSVIKVDAVTVVVATVASTIIFTKLCQSFRSLRIASIWLTERVIEWASVCVRTHCAQRHFGSVQIN